MSPRPPRSYRIQVSQAKTLAKDLAPHIRGGEVFALIGELGSGKTTFTQHLGKALGVETRITSPTFVTMQEHITPLAGDNGRGVFLYHLDLYRMDSSVDSYSEDISALGLDQIWGQPNTITVIEWADKIKPLLPPQTIFIYFSPNNNPR